MDSWTEFLPRVPQVNSYRSRPTQESGKEELKKRRREEEKKRRREEEKKGRREERRKAGEPKEPDFAECLRVVVPIL